MVWFSLIIAFIIIIALYFIRYILPFLISFAILFFVIRWSKNTNRKIISIMAYIILIGIIVFIGIALANIKDKNPSDLYLKIQEINESNELVGLSKAQVVELLGEPLSKSTEEEYRYDAGYVGNGTYILQHCILFDCYYDYDLRVVFDESDIVKSTWMHCTP